MKFADWIFGLIIVLAFIAADIVAPISLYFKWFYILLGASFITLISARFIDRGFSYSIRDIDFFLDAKKNSFNQPNFRNDFHIAFDTSSNGFGILPFSWFWSGKLVRKFS